MYGGSTSGLKMSNGDRGNAWRRRLGDHDPELFDKHAAERIWLTIKAEEVKMDIQPGGSEGETDETVSKNEKTFNDLSPAQKYKLIKQITKPENFNYTKEGFVEILVLADKAGDILSINKIGEYNVSITKHKYKNFVKGTIKHKTIRKSTEEEILEDLCNCRVLEVYIKQTVEKDKEGKIKRDENGEVYKINTDVAEIKFELEQVPPQVYVFGVRLDVEPFKPEAIQCRICFLFTHTSKWCQNKDHPVCYWCSKPAHTKKGERCPNKGHCRNCPEGQDQHSNISKDCPTRQQETEIQTIKVNNKCTYWEAKSLFKSRENTYAKAARNNPPTQSYGNGTGPNTEEIMSMAVKAIDERLKETMDQVMISMKQQMEQQMQTMMQTMIQSMMPSMMQVMMQNMFPQMTGPSLQTNLASQMPTIPNVPNYYSPQAQGYIQNMHSFPSMNASQGSGLLTNCASTLNTPSDLPKNEETFFSGQAGQYEEIPISLVSQLKPVRPGGLAEAKLRLPGSEEPPVKAMKISPGQPPPPPEPGDTEK